MDKLFGTAPQANFSTNPTVDPTQAAIQQLLAGSLTSGAQPAGVQAYQGNFSAPLSPLQSGSVTGLESLLPTATPTAQQGSTATGALDALQKALGFQAPQVAAPQAAAPQQVVAPQIDSSKAFQTGVAQPLIDDFTSQVLPAISGAAGRSAGGAYSSDTELAKNLATKQLGRTLGQQASLYDLGAQTANQGASLTAQTANQSAGDTVNLANLSSILGTNNTNTSAALTGQSDILSALGLTPSVIGAPQVPSSNAASILTALLSGGSVPQQQQQTQLTGQYTDFLNQVSQSQMLRQLLAGFGTTPTQGTSAVGTGGSSGLLPAILAAFAQGGGQAAGKALAGA